MGTSYRLVRILIASLAFTDCAGAVYLWSLWHDRPVHPGLPRQPAAQTKPAASEMLSGAFAATAQKP